MFDRIINITILVAVLALLVLQAVNFLNTNNIAAITAHQIEADQMCMELWRDARGFYANDTYYCETTFVQLGMGGSSILKYDDLAKIMSKQK